MYAEDLSFKVQKRLFGYNLVKKIQHISFYLTSIYTQNTAIHCRLSAITEQTKNAINLMSYLHDRPIKTFIYKQTIQFAMILSRNNENIIAQIVFFTNTLQTKMCLTVE